MLIHNHHLGEDLYGNQTYDFDLLHYCSNLHIILTLHALDLPRFLSFWFYFGVLIVFLISFYFSVDLNAVLHRTSGCLIVNLCWLAQFI